MSYLLAHLKLGRDYDFRMSNGATVRGKLKVIDKANHAALVQEHGLDELTILAGNYIAVAREPMKGAAPIWAGEW